MMLEQGHLRDDAQKWHSCVMTGIAWCAVILIYFSLGASVLDDAAGEAPRLKRTSDPFGSSFVVIGIKSGVEYGDRRAIWRNSPCPEIYRNAGWEYRFVIGTPSKTKRNLTRHSQGAQSTPEEKNLAHQLSKEQRQFNDIDFMAMRDVYMDLTLKTFQWLRLAHAKSSAEHFILHDDDYCVRPDRIRSHLAGFNRMTQEERSRDEMGKRSRDEMKEWHHLAQINGTANKTPETLNNATFGLVDIDKESQTLGVRINEFPGTSHLVWLGQYLFKGKEYHMMKGAANVTMPFFSGSAGSLMNRALVSNLINNAWDQTILFMKFGSASEDANLGKAVANMLLMNGVKHNLCLLMRTTRDFAFKVGALVPKAPVKIMSLQHHHPMKTPLP